MAIITQRGTVDLIPEYNRALRPIFCVSEGDANSRVINLSVTSGGEAFTIPSGAMVYVAGKKQDNNIFTYGCSFTSNTVVFPITAQMSALDGIVLCELQIIQNGNPLGTANFVYWVEPSPIQNGTTSESDLNLFEEAIAKFENFDHFYADVESMVTEAVANMQIREGQTVIDASLTVEGAAADAKATGDIVRAFMDALVTETTPTAAIATCDDAAGGLPLKKLTANIVPTQAGSGDPSPDNVRAISGYSAVNVVRAGRNLIKYASAAQTTSNGITYSINDNGEIVFAAGTATGNGDVYQTLATPILLKAGQAYTFSLTGVTTAGTLSIHIRSGNTYPAYYTLTNNRVTFTPETDINMTGLIVRFRTGASVTAGTAYVQIETGNTATEYEAPQIATYPVTFPTAAGTVYGGTLIVNSDGSGTLTVDRATITFDGSFGVGLPNWRPVDGTSAWLYSASLAPNILKASDPNTNIICDKLPAVPYGWQYNGIYDGAVGISASTGINASWSFAVRVPVSGLTTTETINAWLAENPLTVVYTLATPTTYALSAVQVATMLNGVNNIWTDANGTLTTEYYASTGLYVEKKVNAQRNMIAGVEEAMIATKNYSVNDLLIVGNTLYKVTAAISSGAALVVGTNVTETTVAEQLLALA